MTRKAHQNDIGAQKGNPTRRGSSESQARYAELQSATARAQPRGSANFDSKHTEPSSPNPERLKG